MKSKGDIDAFLKALFKREAGGVDHTKVNSAGYMGKYQFGELALIDLGYYSPDGSQKNDWKGKWKGKHGINSKDDFLKNGDIQDVAAKEWVALLCKRMRTYELDTYIGKTIKGVEITDSGIIAGAHLKGFGSEKSPGVRQFLKSNGEIDSKDGFGTTVSHYVELFAGYDVGCCKQACLAFSEKTTGAPISGMKVQVKKNGAVYKTARTDKTGVVNTPFAFNPGDKIEVLVERIAGGFKSIKAAIVGDANLILALMSPKAKVIVKTEVHTGTPMPRTTSTNANTIPPKKNDPEIDATSRSTVSYPEFGQSGSPALQSTAPTAENPPANTDTADGEVDDLDALEKIWERMCADQGQSPSISSDLVSDETSKQTADKPEDLASIAPSEVDETRNTKGHPLAVVKKKEQEAPKKAEAPMQRIIPGLLFPLGKKPEKSYKTDARKFGSNRSNGRKHAGIDLYAPRGTPILAMADGVVIQSYGFYDETDVIEIDHGDFIVRYGEVDPKQKFVKRGDRVKRGQKIAEVGLLVSLNKSMLHLEMYASNNSPLKKPLTQKTLNPFQRRDDLMDPTSSIDQSVME